MDVCMTVIIGSILFMTASAVIYEYSVKDVPSQACCNGTLGFIANTPHMPCSAMKCCDSTERVVVFPVNHALGYVFKCVIYSSPATNRIYMHRLQCHNIQLWPSRKPKYKITTDCYKTIVPVVTSKETTVVYEDRTCCDGHKFEVLYHSIEYKAALVIRCIRV